MTQIATQGGGVRCGVDVVSSKQQIVLARFELVPDRMNMLTVDE